MDHCCPTRRADFPGNAMSMEQSRMPAGDSIRVGNQLTENERRTLELLLAGMPNKAVAAALEVSVRTAERWRARALRKLGVQTLVEAARIVGPASAAEPKMTASSFDPALSPADGAFSPEWYATAFRGTALGVVTVDLAGRFLSANGAFCNLVGQAESDLVRRHLSAVAHPDDATRDAESLRALFSGAIDSIYSEKRYARPEGVVVPARVMAGLVRDPKGLPIFAIGTIMSR
jgi:PAS domain S-box-containing protein